MSKAETVKKLAKIAAKHPVDAFKSVKYVAKYGTTGLRNRLHDEILASEILPTVENYSPGEMRGSISFSVLIPVYNVDKKWVELAIQSVQNQSYNNWELIIVDDCSDNFDTRDYLSGLNDSRITVRFLENNTGISGATNAAADLAIGDYLVLLDNDDTLAPNALAELYMRISSTHPDILYTDNEVIDESGNRIALFLKPDWSPDLFTAQMYIGHLLAFKRSLFNQVGGCRSEFDGSQDYDLVLRMVEHSGAIEHVAEVLYSWRSLPSSTATNPEAKPYAQIAGQKAIQSHLNRVYGKDTAYVAETENLFVYDVRWNLPKDKPLASIIIPTKDHVDDLLQAVESVLSRTDYPNYEIIILDNNSEEPETQAYYTTLLDAHNNIFVERASYPFNWSKINNQGIEFAHGDVFVCLNNDVVIQSEDWLDRLVENALRPEIGIVGGLLLYPDGTIQHAGVVIGIGGWADHIYKGEPAVHSGNPFISPMVTRNVSAVTGACMAFSRETYETIGSFDEDFIVCGSDVELCLRAKQHGFRNLYLPSVRVTHFESKSRDPKDIPDIDFELSKSAYRPYLLSGDPYFNCNLDYDFSTPTVLSHRKQSSIVAAQRLELDIPEIRPLRFRKSELSDLRLNLLVPSINEEDVYGGISTAINFFEKLSSELKCNTRILSVDCDPRQESVSGRFPEYIIESMEQSHVSPHTIVSVFGRTPDRSIPVSENDVFVCTAWWTAYCIQEEYARQRSSGIVPVLNAPIYLIQDYEPGFYPWSSKYLLAESTYLNETPTIAVFNSQELRNFFKHEGYSFELEYAFNPFLNPSLKEYLDKLNGVAGKRKQILVYGRPETDRNAFELVVESLRNWIDNQPESIQWDFISAGEIHDPVPLGRGKYLASVGKLTLGEYAQVLSESYAGISLMVSPHPSYPPLEMAAFGVRVITNSCFGKDLSGFSDCITSVRIATPWSISSHLDVICSEYKSEVSMGHVPPDYLDNNDAFSFVAELSAVVLNSMQ